MRNISINLRKGDTIRFYDKTKKTISSMFNYNDKPIELIVSIFSDETISSVTALLDNCHLFFYCDDYIIES